MDDKLVVEMRNISKQFPGVLANDRISFNLRGGEIHTLLGENGAGKTTLMKILSGLYEQDEGEIFLQGERVEFHSPRDGFNHGIGMVHQHFMLIHPFTVLENIILGLKSTQEPFLDLDRAREKLTALSDEHHLKTNPDALVSRLSVGERQRVEILKVLYRGARILIMDEPTAVLTPQETKELFAILKSLAKSGCSIVFISHKLDEVMEISDRITVLRDGRVVQTVKPKATNNRSLARMMVGREILFELNKKQGSPGDVLLSVEKISVVNEANIEVLKKVSFDIREGEILGIAGVSGNGQTELAESVSLIRPVDAGFIKLNGMDFTNKSVKDLIDRGVSHIPEDRQERGLFLTLPLWTNIIFTDVGKQPFSSKGILNDNAIRAYSMDVIKQFDVRTPSDMTLAAQLSGGNQQKLIVGRELSRKPKVVVIAVQPTRGLDVGATEYVRNLILEQRDSGTAVLLISTELDEILALADRIAVMYEGEITGVIDAEYADIEEIGLMMAGAKRQMVEEVTNV